MPISEAQRKAAAKYFEKLDEVRIRMPKGKKDSIKTAATAAGESMNQYIINAIDQRMERDGLQEAAGGSTRRAGAGAVSLPSETSKCDSMASEGRVEGNPAEGAAE